MTDAEQIPSIGNKEFLFLEYGEAASSYAKGVDIGFANAKNFFVLNVLLFAFFQTDTNIVEKSAVLAALQRIVPIVGLVVSFGLLVCVVPYFRHLNNCLDRCVEIENFFGGKLFTRNRAISDRKLNTKWVLLSFPLSFIVCWGVVCGVSFFHAKLL